MEKLLSEKGLVTDNCYPKTSFLVDGQPTVSLYKSELDGDFYFYNSFDEKLYKLGELEEDEFVGLQREEFKGKTKYQVPLRLATVIWEDRPFKELPNKAYKDMTLREYACIQLRVAKSGNPWLDEIIEEKNTKP